MSFKLPKQRGVCCSVFIRPGKRIVFCVKQVTGVLPLSNLNRILETFTIACNLLLLDFLLGEHLYGSGPFDWYSSHHFLFSFSLWSWRCFAWFSRRFFRCRLCFLFRLRNGTLHQVTESHSFMWLYLSIGEKQFSKYIKSEIWNLYLSKKPGV